MRSSYLDYLISSLLLTGIIVFSAAIVQWVARPIYSSILPEFEVLLSLALFALIFGLTSGVLIRLLVLLPQLKPAAYPMSDPRFQWWKTVGILHEFALFSLRPFSILFLRPFFQKLFGARIGSDVVLGGTLIDPWFIEIQDQVVLGLNSAVIAHEMISGHIKLKPVKICRGATIGVNTVIMPGAIVGENSIIAPGSVVVGDTIVPANQFWAGTPAKFKKVLYETKNES